MDSPVADVAPPRLRVATYNVHGCIGMDGKRSEARVAEVIASMNVDVVGLQELDSNRLRSGHVNQAELIAQQLGWNCMFESAIRETAEQYGNAIISRHPLTSRRAIELPGKGTWYCRETRVAICAEATTALGVLSIVTTHLGLGRAERRAQAEHLASALPGDLPLVVLGDFNSLPGSRSLEFLRQRLQDVRRVVRDSRLHRTYPTRLPAVAVDHIFASAALRPISITSHRTLLARVASDHFPLLAELERT